MSYSQRKFMRIYLLVFGMRCVSLLNAVAGYYCCFDTEHRSAVHQRMRPHICELCPPGSTSRFAKKNDWYRHRLRVHNIPKTYPCNEHGCAEVFSQKELLHKHVRVAHHSRKPFPCNLCDLAYSRKSSLSKHLIDKHCQYMPE